MHRRFFNIYYFSIKIFAKKYFESFETFVISLESVDDFSLKVIVTKLFVLKLMTWNNAHKILTLHTASKKYPPKNVTVFFLEKHHTSVKNHHSRSTLVLTENDKYLVGWTVIWQFLFFLIFSRGTIGPESNFIDIICNAASVNILFVMKQN